MSDFTLLDLLAAENHPLGKDEERLAILDAIQQAANANHGGVHASWVRQYLPADVNPHRVGAVMSALVKQGTLIDTGEVLRSDGSWQN